MEPDLDSPPHHAYGRRSGRVPADHHSRDPAAGASRDGGGGEWTREPPDRTRGGRRTGDGSGRQV